MISAPSKSGDFRSCHQHVRTKIDHADKDRIFAKDIAKAHAILNSNELNLIAEEVAQQEHIDLNGDHNALFRIS